MGSISCYPKVDTISSAEISCLGFFANFHPVHNNRDRLQRYLSTFLKVKLVYVVELSLFSRLVYVGKGLEKTESRATVFEVTKEFAQAVINALFECLFDDYENVQFVPFMKVDDLYDITLKSMFTNQNNLCRSIEYIAVKHLNYLSEDIQFLSDTSSLREILIPSNFVTLFMTLT